jgi:hypothetical protein
MNSLLLNFGMGILGLLTFVVFTSFDKIKDKNYGLTQHFNENYKRWIWALSMLILIIVTVHLEPAIAEFINNLIGLDLITKAGSYWATGVVLAKFVKNTVDKVE